MAKWGKMLAGAVAALAFAGNSDNADAQVKQTSWRWPAPASRNCNPFNPLCDPVPAPAKAPTDPGIAPAPTPTPEVPALTASVDSLAPTTSAALGSSSISVGAGGVGAGAGAVGAAQGAGDAFFGTTTVQTTTPLILPGLFTAVSPQSVVPLDRVSLGYGYFDSFNTFNASGQLVHAFNLNLFNIFVEKTLFDSMASIYVSAPILWESQNNTAQQIDGFGDVSAGFKVVLFNNPQSGSLFSAGLTVTAPTGREAVITTVATNTNDVNFPPTTTTTATTTTNPTFIQPWTGGLLVLDRLFVEGYLGVVIPTDSRLASLLNTNFNLGYNIYRNPCGTVTWITPVLGLQTLLPVNHTAVQPTSGTTVTLQGEPLPVAQAPTTFGFPTQVFLTETVQVGLGEQASFYFGVATPVVSPRGYNVGGLVGVTFLY